MTPRDPSEPRPSPPSNEGPVAAILQFTRFLNQEGMSIPPGEVLTALHALRCIEPLSYPRCRDALRAALARNPADWTAFEQRFRRFWLSETPPPGPPPPHADETAVTRAPYSPHALYAEPQIPHNEDAPVDPVAGLLIRTLVRRFRRRRNRPVRRRQPGRRLDLPATLKKSLSTGGEPVRLVWKHKPKIPRPVVYLCDVSGSMEPHALNVLNYLRALTQAKVKTEFFCFSTRLTRVTPLLKNNRHISLSDLSAAVTDFGGGTRIGACIAEYNAGSKGAARFRRPVVILFSDGWDRGDIRLLRMELGRLKRSAHRFFWINPHLGTKGFQPLCEGLQAALPYPDAFLPGQTPRDLGYLADMLAQALR